MNASSNRLVHPYDLRSCACNGVTPIQKSPLLIYSGYESRRAAHRATQLCAPELRQIRERNAALEEWECLREHDVQLLDN
jgi:hypothetical protein